MREGSEVPGNCACRAGRGRAAGRALDVRGSIGGQGGVGSAFEEKEGTTFVPPPGPLRSGGRRLRVDNEAVALLVEKDSFRPAGAR